MWSRFMKKDNKKTINIKAKTSLWPPLKIKKINSKYLKNYKSTKKDK